MCPGAVGCLCQGQHRQPPEMHLEETRLEELSYAPIINQRRHLNGSQGLWQQDRQKWRDDVKGVTEKSLAADSNLQNTVQMIFFHLQEAVGEAFRPHLQSSLGCTRACLMGEVQGWSPGRRTPEGLPRQLRRSGTKSSPIRASQRALVMEQATAKLPVPRWVLEVSRGLESAGHKLLDHETLPGITWFCYHCLCLTLFA